MKEIKGGTFLVTGGAGFIGSNIVGELLAQGAQKVRVLDDLSGGSEENIKEFRTDKRFDFIKGDIRDLKTCEKACEEMEYISHQAALCSVPRSIEEPTLFADVNISGFIQVLEAARKAGVKRVVYASSSSVYGDKPAMPKTEDDIGEPLSPYAATKRANELYGRIFANIYDMQIIGLRYFNVFGPKQNPQGAYAAAIPLFINMILRGESPKIFGDGEQLRDFTYIDNVVDLNLKALFSEKAPAKGEVYNGACGRKASVNELFANLKQISGGDIEALYMPERKGDIRDSLADISRAKEYLDYAPLVNFREGLEKTFRWFKDRNAGDK
ncbi:MAG: SDR family oxidoreductase [Candidatus Harrisonbacteria bacterium]|nr:SDR family oxidoreductase [Candidatus Harrisonbacteria bacterium]